MTNNYREVLLIAHLKIKNRRKFQTISHNHLRLGNTKQDLPAKFFVPLRGEHIYSLAPMADSCYLIEVEMIKVCICM